MGSNARAGLKQLSEGFERKKFRGKMRGVRLDKWWPVASGIVVNEARAQLGEAWVLLGDELDRQAVSHAFCEMRQQHCREQQRAAKRRRSDTDLQLWASKALKKGCVKWHIKTLKKKISGKPFCCGRQRQDRFCSYCGKILMTVL
ncbi:unnamed protein product [Durusdinium trenchii]